MKIKSVKQHTVGTGEITYAYAEQTFKELLAFQGYGFCFGYDCEVETPSGKKPIGKLQVGDLVLTPGDKDGQKWARVSNVIPQGKKQLFLVEFRKSGLSIKCTIDHKFLCNDGVMRPIRDIMGSKWNIMGHNLVEHHITDVTYLDEYPVIDITVETKDHLFYCNDLIASNCKAHATSYAMYSAVQMYLQEKYFIEYMSVLLTHIDRSDEKKGVPILNERVAYCIKNGCGILYPSVNKPSDKWEIEGGSIRASIKNIKGFNDKDVKNITDNAPYKDLRDFVEKVKFTSNKFDTLIYSNALSDFGDVETIYNWYHNQYLEEAKKTKVKKQETLSLFDDDEEATIEELPTRKFSENELRELSLDVNGFYIEENLRIEYDKYYQGGMNKFNHDFHTDIKHVLSSNTKRILNVTQAKSITEKDSKSSGTLDSKTPDNKHFFMICKVLKSSLAKTKLGSTFLGVTLGDGCDVLETKVFAQHIIPKWAKAGTHVLLQMTINEQYINIIGRNDAAFVIKQM